jgi:hypothetical protein
LITYEPKTEELRISDYPLRTTASGMTFY